MTDQERELYLRKHLPYRLNSMLAHDLMLWRKKQPLYRNIRDACYGDSLVVEPMFEASLIFGRSLLNFIGVACDWDGVALRRHTPKGTDLTIKHLIAGREFCPVSDSIVQEHESSLLVLLKRADKSVAHMTATVLDNADLEQIPRARMAIYSLYRRYLPEVDYSAVWWHAQVAEQH
jgi:hypothetical protein